jgi:type II secretory pathway pseudopilin PulG
MKRNSKNFGFTLVEIIVVVSSVGIIMMIVVGTILQTMKAQNRSEALSRLSDEGNWILSELRRNIFNSNGVINCQPGNLAVGLSGLSDKVNTVLSCDSSVANNMIASTSGTKVRKLNANDVNVTNCSNFAVCSIVDGKVSSVTFNFGIGTTVSGVSTSQDFSTTLTLRNN